MYLVPRLNASKRLHSAKSASPHSEASTEECLLSLQRLTRLRNQTEDETQPEEMLCFLSKLFCLITEIAQTRNSWLNTLAKYSFLSNELSARGLGSYCTDLVLWLYAQTKVTI